MVRSRRNRTPPRRVTLSCRVLSLFSRRRRLRRAYGLHRLRSTSAWGTLPSTIRVLHAVRSRSRLDERSHRHLHSTTRTPSATDGTRSVRPGRPVSAAAIAVRTTRDAYNSCEPPSIVSPSDGPRPAAKAARRVVVRPVTPPGRAVVAVDENTSGHRYFAPAAASSSLLPRAGVGRRTTSRRTSDTA